jgi:hypothetical protein
VIKPEPASADAVVKGEVDPVAIPATMPVRNVSPIDNLPGAVYVDSTH